MNAALRKYLDDMARRDADRAPARGHGGGTAPRAAAPGRAEPNSRNVPTKSTALRTRGRIVANHKCAPGGDVLRAEHAIFGSVEQFADDTIAFLDGCQQSCVESAVLRV